MPGNGVWTLVSPDGQEETYGTTRRRLVFNVLHVAFLKWRYPEAFARSVRRL